MDGALVSRYDTALPWAVAILLLLLTLDAKAWQWPWETNTCRNASDVVCEQLKADVAACEDHDVGCQALGIPSKAQLEQEAILADGPRSPYSHAERVSPKEDTSHLDGWNEAYRRSEELSEASFWDGIDWKHILLGAELLALLAWSR